MIDPPEGGVWKPTTILCHAVLTIEKWRLAQEPIGQIADASMDAVVTALGWVFERPAPIDTAHEGEAAPLAADTAPDAENASDDADGEAVA